MTQAYDATRDPGLDLAAVLTAWRARVERALERYLPPADAAPTRLHEAMRYAILNGGKRVRACLVYAAGEAVGATPEVLDVPACAVELVHGYSLVHDDLPCMDDDDLRRGKPTCHKAYDEPTALLAGDALQSLAFEILYENSKSSRHSGQRLKMVYTLARAIGSVGMVGGQAIDLESEGKNLELSAVEDMHRRKTGCLIQAAVVLGSQAGASVDPALAQALERYGAIIGLAFQVADDILDVEGESACLGKTTGADAARSKPTYPSVIGLDAAKRKAQALYQAALESLQPLGDNTRLLAALARYVIERRH